MECPYCNGSGHHNYKDCIRCNGTGDYEQPLSKVTTPKANISPKKLILSWLGFIAMIPLLVYAVIFLKRLGIVYEVSIILLSILSWIIILGAVGKLVLNSKRPKHEKMLFLNPDDSLVEKSFGLAVILVLAVSLISIAVLPLVWLIK